MQQFDQMIIVDWRIVELISCDCIISLINFTCLRWHANSFIAAWCLSNVILCMAKEDKRKKTKKFYFYLFIYLSCVRLVTPAYVQIQLETCVICQITGSWVQQWTTIPICMKQCLLILLCTWATGVSPWENKVGWGLKSVTRKIFGPVYL